MGKQSWARLNTGITKSPPGPNLSIRNAGPGISADPQLRFSKNILPIRFKGRGHLASAKRFGPVGGEHSYRGSGKNHGKTETASREQTTVTSSLLLGSWCSLVLKVIFRTRWIDCARLWGPVATQLQCLFALSQVGKFGPNFPT